MSEIGWCVVGFCFLCISTLLLGVLLRAAGVLQVPSLEEIQARIQAARDRFERVALLLLIFLKLWRGGFIGFLLAVWCAGCTCLAAICGWSWLTEWRDLLLEFARWVMTAS